jgi:hypothetical protein
VDVSENIQHLMEQIKRNDKKLVVTRAGNVFGTTGFGILWHTTQAIIVMVN